MKKLIKITAVLAGILVLLIIALTIVVKSYLSSGRLKSIILPKAEALTGRKVQLEEISVSLFKGIVAKGLSVKDKDEQEDFIKIERFVLSYRLLPLLKKELIISKIEIISPSIFIKKEKEGKYSFSDIMEKGSQGFSKSSVSTGPEYQSLPVSIITDRLSIRNADIKFVDEGKILSDVSITFDVEIKGGVEEDETPRLDFANISLKEFRANLKNLIVTASGKVNLDARTIHANLQAMVGKDIIDIDAKVNDYPSDPDIVANLYAKTLDMEHLMKLSGDRNAQEDRTPMKEEKAQPLKDSESGIMQKIKAEGEIKVDQGKYQDYTIKDVRIRYQFSKGVMKVDPICLKFSSKGSLTTEGCLNGNI